MSRPKVRTSEADRLIHDEALRRVEYRSNKQLATILDGKGIHLSPAYIGELVKTEANRIRSERELFRRAHVSRGTTENGNSSGTIKG